MAGWPPALLPAEHGPAPHRHSSSARLAIPGGPRRLILLTRPEPCPTPHPGTCPPPPPVPPTRQSAFPVLTGWSGGCLLCPAACPRASGRRAGGPDFAQIVAVQGQRLRVVGCR